MRYDDLMKVLELQGPLEDQFFMCNWSVFVGMLEAIESKKVRYRLLSKFILEFRRSLTYVLYESNGFNPDECQQEIWNLLYQTKAAIRSEEDAAELGAFINNAESTKKRRGL